MKSQKTSHFRSGLRFLLFYINVLLLTPLLADAQTLGGSKAYTFLELSPTPVLTAAGGLHISSAANDVGVIPANPALLKRSMHGQVGTSFHAFFAGIQAYNLSVAFYDPSTQTTVGASLFFINYGETTATDAAGNISGSLHPVDYVMQLSASKKYLEKWSYGLSVKFVNSHYGLYSSSAIAADVGVLYADSARYFSAAVTAKNMGAPLRSYGGRSEELPFDMQVGITKKLEKAPLAFSITLHHLHQFYITYHDTTFNRANNFTNGSSHMTNLFNHIVLATHLTISNNLEAIFGYNFLRRSELNLGASGNGINGFSAGFSASFKKIKVQYARAYYQRNLASNQFGLVLLLNEWKGLGSL